MEFPIHASGTARDTRAAIFPFLRPSVLPLIRTSARPRFHFPAFIILHLMLGSTAIAQTVMLPVRHPVYEYLDRIEAKYTIPLLQFARPLPRMEIARALDSLARSPFPLSTYDRNQLAFYAGEFNEEIRRLRPARIDTVSSDRWHLLRIRGSSPSEHYFAADLVGGGLYEKREDADDLIRRSNGVQAYGYVGPWLGAFMRWYDNGRSGIAYDARASRTREQGVIKAPSKSQTSYDYEVAEGQLFYSNPWLLAGVQKSDLWFGSGRFGAIILSDKAPSFPLLRFQVRISDWLAFDYMHAWLFSDSLDFTRTYTVPGAAGAKFYETKYFASHHLTARVLPNLQVTLGESIIYSGGDVNLLFLIPVVSFRAADRWTRATSGNSQFFADVRYTPLRGLTVYASGLLDEMDLSKAFSSDKTDFDLEAAFTIGGIATDIFKSLVPSASETRFEFSRVLPFVYANPAPTQQYSSHQVTLGHWIGANADLLALEHAVHLTRSFETAASLSFVRFGDASIVRPSSPRPPAEFLMRPQYSVTRAAVSFCWTPAHDLFVKIHGAYTSVTEKENYGGSPDVRGLSFGAAVSYGLQ